MESRRLERKWAKLGVWAGLRRTLRERGDVALAIRIGVFLLMLPRRMRSAPLGAHLAELGGGSKAGAGSLDAGVERIRRLRQAWLASPLLRSRNTCYMRALTLYRFLDGGGQDLRIHFGVEPGMDPGDRLHGHAWVSADGRLLEAPTPVLAGRVSEIYVYPEVAAEGDAR